VRGTPAFEPPAMPGKENPLQCKGLIFGEGHVMLGYMLTWTTYGTWLQGDKRGYVKNGRVLQQNKALQTANMAALKTQPIRLTLRERDIVREAVLQEAQRLQQKIYSIAVCSDHVHLVANRIDQPPGKVAGRYKKAATTALRENGLAGPVWTKGYDKRFCFDEKALQSRIAYVRRHEGGKRPG